MAINSNSIKSILQWQSECCKNSIDVLNFSLSNLFIFPNQVAYIVDCGTGKIIEATNNFGKIFGYQNQKLECVEQLYEPILKSDLSSTLQHTYHILDWIFKNEDVPAGMDGAEFKYNIRTKSGKTRRILRQTASCGKVSGKITHTLGILSDISHWENSSTPTVKAHGPTAIYFNPKFPEINESRSLLTLRECEILNLLAKGCTSKTIANHLHISRHTVDTHRRNMLQKFEAENTSQLIYLARATHLID